MRKIVGIFLVTLIAVTSSWTVSVAEKENIPVVTISELMSGIKDYEKKKVTVQGVSVGTCISGGKMWISEGEYKEGAPVILVRAKDDAFKFDRRAVGQEVRLQGFPLAYYVDYCSSDDKTSADPKTKVTHSKEMEEKVGDLESITIIAESIEYL